MSQKYRVYVGANNAVVSGNIYINDPHSAFRCPAELFCGINYSRVTYRTEMSISPFNPSFTLSIAEIKQARAFLYERS